jgi:lipopolysaccharide transport system permease protein
MPFSQYFRLIDIQARMSLRADASRFFLGYIWWILEPLLFVAVFYVVFNIILDSRKADFLVFLMCGKLTFIWFSKSVSNASNSIISSKGLIGKIDIPKTMFPMTMIQQAAYKQVVVFILLFCVLWVYDYFPTLTWLWAVPVIVVNYLMIVACSFVGAYLVCLMRDFSLVITLAMTFLLFTSGIFWDVRDLGSPEKTAAVLAYNPLAFILDAYRQILMYQTPPDTGHLLLIGFVSLFVIAFMGVLLQRSSKFLALKALTS